MNEHPDQPSFVIMAAVADALQLCKEWRETEHLLWVLGPESMYCRIKAKFYLYLVTMSLTPPMA